MAPRTGVLGGGSLVSARRQTRAETAWRPGARQTEYDLLAYGGVACPPG